MDNPLPKPDCAVAEYVYPASWMCINALISLGFNTSDNIALVKPYAKPGGYRYTKAKAPPVCVNCDVMIAANLPQAAKF